MELYSHTGKKRKKAFFSHFSASQQTGAPCGRLRRACAPNRFSAVHDYYAQAGEIIGKVGQIEAIRDKGDAGYFGWKGLTVLKMSRLKNDMFIKDAQLFRRSFPAINKTKSAGAMKAITTPPIAIMWILTPLF